MATRFEELDAKGMFEALGYECETDTNYIDYKKYIKDIKQYAYILFDFKSKTIQPTMEYNSTYSLELDMPLLQAINKQIEELGWLEDVKD